MALKLLVIVKNTKKLVKFQSYHFAHFSLATGYLGRIRIDWNIQIVLSWRDVYIKAPFNNGKNDIRVRASSYDGSVNEIVELISFVRTKKNSDPSNTFYVLRVSR